MEGSASKLLKRLSIDKYGLYALLIIALAVCLRTLLTVLGWPATNSDEGTFGIMARHIAYNGGHPIFLYGYNYMGALEAYLGAAFFRLFGASLLSLRLGVILLYALFLTSMYLLTSLLYTKKLALFVLVLLSLGSSGIVLREVYATGGSTQTLLFGALAFLLASWLALTYRQDLPRGGRWLRFAGYTGWGLAVGLAIWSDLVVLPFLSMSSLLLLLFCWHDLPSWAPLCLLLGFVIGVSPLIVYNLQAASGQDSFSTFWGLFHGSNAQSVHTLSQLVHGIIGTVRMSLPTATGDPTCPVPAVDFASDASPYSLHCTLLHTGWSAGYILLWIASVFLTLRGCWQLRTPRIRSGSLERRREIVLHVARLSLLASAAVAIVSYAVSSAPQSMPHSHARYLVGLLVVTPALIWPVWSAISAPSVKETVERRFRGSRAVGIFNKGVLLLIAVLFLLGTITIAGDLSSSQEANRQQDALITNLEHVGATHIYSDYWTCDRINFVSQEKIICGVTDRRLSPTHNRYYPYYTIVKADPHSAYVYTFDIFRQAALMRQADRVGHGFRRFVFDGYIIYQPA